MHQVLGPTILRAFFDRLINYNYYIEKKKKGSKAKGTDVQKVVVHLFIIINFNKIEFCLHLFLTVLM